VVTPTVNSLYNIANAMVTHTF